MGTIHLLSMNPKEKILLLFIVAAFAIGLGISEYKKFRERRLSTQTEEIGIYSQTGINPDTLCRIDINCASVRELQLLPGIGPVLARRIVSFREEYGPFRQKKELLKVSGIGERKLDRIRNIITVSD